MVALLDSNARQLGGGTLVHREPVPEGAPYFTDASALTPAYGNVATVVIGPGEMGQAHQTDEYCHVARIEQAVEIYRRAIVDWCGL